MLDALTYRLFLADASVSDEAKSIIRTKMQSLEDAAAKNYVRFGSGWTAREKVEKAQEDAEAEVRQGLELLATGNERTARDKLEQASKTDLNATRPDFLLGILDAYLSRKYQNARTRFAECIRRDPNNVCALNNMALVEIMLNNHELATKFFRDALAIDPAVPEIAQNIRRVLNQEALKNLAVPSASATAYANLYSQVVDEGATPSSNKVGWLYMAPIVSSVDNAPWSDEIRADRIPTAAKSKAKAKTKGKSTATDGSVIRGGGSGFVVYPHYVLTNRHVADAGNDYLIMDPNNKDEKKLHASLFAKCADHDLALLKCDELSAPAVSLNPNLPGRGSDIMLLGFPEFFKIGIGLKSTRGAIVGLPGPDTDDMCLYDATSNPGNSGGPVCDNSGRVVAIHRAGLNFSGKLAAGIPIDQALPFIKERVPDFRSSSLPHHAADWSEVDSVVSKSTVLVLCKSGRETQLKIGGKLQTESLEDEGCVRCLGTGKLICPDCGGKGTYTEGHVENRSSLMGAPTGEYKFVRKPCPTCHGTGTITCPLCRGDGRDPSLH